MALYSHCFPHLFCMVLRCLLMFYKFAVNMEWFLLKYTEVILTISTSSPVFSCMISYPSSLTALDFLLLHTLWKWPTLLHSIHILPYAGHCLGGCVLPQYLHAGHDGVLCCAGTLWLLVHIDLDTFILSNSLDSVIAFITAAWALFASTLFAHTSTFPLVICSSLFTVFNCLIISSSMFLSLSPWINCSFSCLSTFW